MKRAARAARVMVVKRMFVRGWVFVGPRWYQYCEDEMEGGNRTGYFGFERLCYKDGG